MQRLPLLDSHDWHVFELSKHIIIDRVPQGTMVHQGKMGHLWIIVIFSKLGRCYNWKLPRYITSSYILLIYIT